MPVERRGEGRHQLVGQFPFLPQPAGLVDELLELRGQRAEPVAELPGILQTLTDNVDTRRPRHPDGRRHGQTAESATSRAR
ncbi:hypothetical protein ACTWPT_54520 [Nonomuraea sp. 3N208]|uniref:hypothetical protein n=1 Tax=Nonomuraea sp. 3N208 TaxID=3457421 RepID=UPI003FCF4277